MAGALRYCRAVVLAHDKPGCGGSPGNWLEQTFENRARESLAALGVLRAHPACNGRPVGLLGFSQGGWVALLAATEGEVDFVISVSGPGVTPEAQDRDRIERELQARGTESEAVAEAMRWIDERTRRLRGGEPVEDVLADQLLLADRSWYAGATQYFDNLPALSFLSRLLDFDPAPVLRRVPCPCWRSSAPPTRSSRSGQALRSMRRTCPSFPATRTGSPSSPGSHGLFIADPDPAVPRTEQLAPGFLPMIAGFLSGVASGPSQELLCREAEAAREPRARPLCDATRKLGRHRRSGRCDGPAGSRRRQTRIWLSCRRPPRP